MRRHLLPVVLVFAAALPAAAQPPVVSLPSVQASPYLHVFKCQHRALPSQRQVGEWLHQDNFGQVYASRARLMAEVGRTCQRPGTGEVDLVAARQPVDETASGSRVALAGPASR